jgi:hypothetical protein
MSISLPFYLCPCFYLYVSIYLSHSFFAFLSLSLCLSTSLFFLSFYFSMSIFASLFKSFYLSPSLFLSIHLFLHLFQSIYFLSISFSMYLYNNFHTICVCISTYKCVHFIKFVYTYFPCRNSIAIKRFDKLVWQSSLTNCTKAMRTPWFTKRPLIYNYRYFWFQKILGQTLEKRK